MRKLEGGDRKGRDRERKREGERERGVRERDRETGREVLAAPGSSQGI